MDEKELTNKKEIFKKKLSDWLKDHHNFTFVIVISLIILIRLYYFWMTKNQALWWDEAEYMAMAKGFAGIAEYSMNSLRLPGFPILVSIFYFLGITNEVLLRFILAYIPSIIAILLLYYLLKEMYTDKKIAIISTAIFGLLWESVFYSNRFHTENLSIIFEFLAFIIIYKSYIKKQDFLFVKKKYFAIWVVLFFILSVLFRSGNLPILPTFFFIFILVNFSLFLKKENRLKTGIFVVAILILSIFFLMNITKIPIIKDQIHLDYPTAWIQLTVFSGFYQSYIPNVPSVLFITFLLGLIITTITLILGYDLIPKFKNDTEHLDFKSDIINLFMIVSIMFVFVFFKKDNGFEFRWYFMLLPAMLAFTAKGIIGLSEFVGKYVPIKNFALYLIIFLTLIGVYNQYLHTDMIIKYKLDSYMPVKESALFLKSISNPDDILVSSSYTQYVYYSERKVRGFPTNESDFYNEIKEFKPKYLMVSIFEPGFTPQWVYDWPMRNNNTVIPLKAYYLDKEQKQLGAVVYQFV